MLQRSLVECEALRTWSPEEGLLIAVSGGADSVSLVHAWVSYRGPSGVVIGHVDHGLRPDSPQDQRLVETLGDALGVPVSACQVKVCEGQGLQDAARRARAAALEAMRSQQNLRFILTAHTADDQAETLLMRLIRGVGPRGAGCMRPAQGRLVRPFLETVGRQQTRGYCAALGLDYRDDPSNKNPRFDRCYVREQLLPELRARNPRVVESLVRSTRLFAEEDDYMEGRCEHHFAELSLNRGELARWPLAKIPQALGRRLILRLWTEADPEARPELRHLETMLELLRSDRRKPWLHPLPGGATARIDREKIAIYVPGTLQKE